LDAGGVLDVLEWVAGDEDQIGQRARFNGAKVFGIA
jgi:hypothetical protein